MLNIFFSSDQHLCHTRILELCPNRPYKSVEEMNESFIENHNKVVGRDGLVFFLGDFVMGLKSENLPKITPRLNGIKVLILGNHDTDFKKAQMYLDAGFICVYEHHLYLYDFALQHDLNENLFPSGQDIPNILMCHFPAIVTDGHHVHEDRYAKLRPDPATFRKNTLLLHGHTHSKVARTGPRQIHVGVDSWNMTPVSLDQILDLHFRELQEDPDTRQCILCNLDIKHSNCTFD